MVPRGSKPIWLIEVDDEIVGIVFGWIPLSVVMYAQRTWPDHCMLSIERIDQ